MNALQLFRHGDRNILKPYINDPWFSEKYWLEGFSQLTKIGKQQMFELGAYLRQRYYKLLPDSGQYHVDHIYVQSTDTDRTLNSAAYALAAMFPPMNEQIWDKSLMWQASENIKFKIEHFPRELHTHIFVSNSFQFRFTHHQNILIIF